MKSKMIELINSHRSILIMTHLKPDGDAIGSSFGLAKGLHQLGKTVRILSNDRIPYDVQFLDDQGFYQDSIEGFEYSLIITLDSSDLSRLDDRKEALTKPILNIDHHRTNTLYGELNWVDETASATGEMVYDLLAAMNVEMDSGIAQDLYVAIATDTGQFMYSNTTSRTHGIVSDLLKSGVDVASISRILYQNTPLEKFRLDARVLSYSTFHYGKKLAVTYMTLADQEEFNCHDSDNIVEALRNIETVEVAALLVERDGLIKVSMRSKDRFDVSDVAVKYGGGGHPNAAGFSVQASVEEARTLILKEFEYLEERDDKCCQTTADDIT